MTSFLSYSQQIELERRVARALAPGKVGTHGSSASGLTDKEIRTFEVVVDCLNDMKREGKL